MALTHATALRIKIADLSVDDLDLGTTDLTGDVSWTTSVDVEVVNTTLQNPAFGAANASAVATLLGVPLTSNTAASGGTVTKIKFRDRNNASRFEGSVAASGADVNVTTPTLAVGESIRLDSLTYTACP